MPRYGTEYGLDPLEILIRREEKTCKGCVHIERIRIVDAERRFCRLRDIPADERCSAYDERKPTSTGARK